MSRDLADGRSSIDDLQITGRQFNGGAVAFDSAAVDGLASALEKVREAVAHTRGDTGDDR